jgi:inhibitor of cysteine peptidase
MRCLGIVYAIFYSCFVFASPMEMNLDVSAKTFDVLLPANPTTGYRWVVSDLDDSHLEKVGETYHPSNAKAIGSGGTMCFTFKRKNSKKLDKTIIRFKYQRPWENKSVDTREVTVHFCPKK